MNEIHFAMPLNILPKLDAINVMCKAYFSYPSVLSWIKGSPATCFQLRVHPDQNLIIKEITYITNKTW